MRNSAAPRAVEIAPTEGNRAKFEKIVEGVARYEKALHGVTASEQRTALAEAVAAYDAAA